MIGMVGVDGPGTVQLFNKQDPDHGVRQRQVRQSDALVRLATYIYQNAFDYWNMGYASALALCLFLLIIGLSLITVRYGERKVHYSGK